MLLNISYNDPEVKRRIEKAVGKPFSLQKRWKLGGIGSPKLFMNSCSIDIHNLLILDQNINQFYKLKIYKGKAKEYSIYMDHYFIKVLADKESIHHYFKKVMDQKTSNLPPALEDL
jgi:hypothetical protein